MDYDEDKIRAQIIAGLKGCEPSRVELEQFDYGGKLGVYYRSPMGLQRVQTETAGKTEDQIAFALLSLLLNGHSEPRILHPVPPIASPYEGKRGKHPKSCTCSKHKGLDGAQAA